MVASPNVGCFLRLEINTNFRNSEVYLSRVYFRDINEVSFNFRDLQVLDTLLKFLTPKKEEYFIRIVIRQYQCLWITLEVARFLCLTPSHVYGKYQVQSFQFVLYV